MVPEHFVVENRSDINYLAASMNEASSTGDPASMTPRKKARVQATQVTYELHSLGWKAFQDLCATIAREVWGQTLQTFHDSRDGGRDGAFSGVWLPKKGEAFAGPFTSQCKFTGKRDKQLALVNLKDELLKAKRLADKGLAKNYILMTNASLTGTAEETIRTKYLAIPGIERFAAYGSEWISQVIRQSATLRMLVPRIYGLGDLGQILDERAYAQAREILSAVGDDLAKFVITDVFRRSAKALDQQGFVLLLGEPTSGKSTIAAALALGAVDVWGCMTLKIRDADDFARHWNPNDPKQFFWVDDAFGPTQFDWSLAASWNRVFAHLNAAIRKGARVLFTSRDYVYRAARQHLKESAFPLMRESQSVIQVELLTKEEREQILYNHIRLGTQPTEFRRRLKPFLPSLAIHQRFTPEIARRLGNPLFTRELRLSQPALQRFLEHPLELLLERHTHFGRWQPFGIGLSVYAWRRTPKPTATQLGRGTRYQSTWGSTCHCPGGAERPRWHPGPSSSSGRRVRLAVQASYDSRRLC